MIEQIVLETEGFRFSFNIDYGWTDQEYLGMIVMFQLLRPLPELVVRSERTSISIVDLRRLQMYMEQHMEKMKEKNGDAISDAFVNWELGFQLQAFEGNVEPPMDDMFSISCQVNVGNGRNGHRVFVGGESDVTFEQARAFLHDIHTFLNELPALPTQVIPFGDERS